MRPPKITIDELLNRVTADLESGDLDFIATAQTPWNSLGVCAALREEYPDGTGIITLTPDPLEGYMLKPNDFDSTPGVDAHFYRLSNERGVSDSEIPYQALRTLSGFVRAKQHYDTTQEVGIITPADRFRPYIRPFSSKQVASTVHPRLITIDAGLFSYLKFQPQTKLKDPLNPSRIGRSIYELCVKQISNWYFSRVPHVDRCLFSKENGQFIANKGVVESYRAILPTISQTRNNLALIVTQPFSEKGMISSRVEKSTLRGLISDLHMDGFDVTVRPHPREEPKKYKELGENSGVQLETSSNPIEKDLYQIKPEIIIGYTSTSLLTANVLYNIPAYSVANRLAGEWSDTSQEDLANRFLQHFNTYVHNYDDEIHPLD